MILMLISKVLKTNQQHEMIPYGYDENKTMLPILKDRRKEEQQEDAPCRAHYYYYIYI